MGDLMLSMAVGIAAGLFTYLVGSLLAASPQMLDLPPDRASDVAIDRLTTVNVWTAGLGVAGMVVATAIASHRWSGAAVLGYLGLTALITGFIAYALTVSTPQVPAGQRTWSYLLLAAESAGLLLILISSVYSLDASSRKRWDRNSPNRPWDPHLQPTVAAIVPIYNEPVEMVEETVRTLVNQDYPSDRLHVIVADDSTDPGVRNQVKAACKKLGAQHVTRPQRVGYKAGAINHVLRRLPEHVDLVAVLDADYWSEPHFLKSTVGYFTDPSLAFVQTPQDYRNTRESFLARQYHRAESYFYHAVMPARNEQDTILFCGTMGVLRRQALEDVGGFAEDQVCEDADLSARMAAHGWSSLYLSETLGRGLAPATFGAYKKQFDRWAFGNVRILITRAPMILRSKMRRRQKFDLLAGGLHWFDGFFITGIALLLLYLGFAPLFGHDAVTHHQREMPLIALVPLILFADGLLRMRGAFARGGPGRLRQILLIQGMWFSIKVTNMRAALRAVLGFRTPFRRTPKEPGHRLPRARAFVRTLRTTPVETLLGTLLVAAGGVSVAASGPETPLLGRILLPVWLGIYALFFLSAPIYAYLAYRTRSQAGLAIARPTGSAHGTPRPPADARSGGRRVAAARPARAHAAAQRRPIALARPGRPRPTPHDP